MGTYIKQTNTFDHRHVYKYTDVTDETHNNTSVYLYFDEKELTWKIGSKVGGPENTVRMRVFSLATTPDLITEKWQVLRMYINTFQPALGVKSICSDQNQDSLAAHGGANPAAH